MPISIDQWRQWIINRQNKVCNELKECKVSLLWVGLVLGSSQLQCQSNPFANKGSFYFDVSELILTIASISM